MHEIIKRGEIGLKLTNKVPWQSNFTPVSSHKGTNSLIGRVSNTEKATCDADRYRRIHSTLLEDTLSIIDWSTIENNQHTVYVSIPLTAFQVFALYLVCNDWRPFVQ
jgi:hypothetical protein